MPPRRAFIDHGPIRLEPAKPEDLSAWRTFMQDPEVMKFIFGGWNPDDKELTELLTRNLHYWDRYEMGWWSVSERTGGDIIANCVLDVSCSGDSEIGYIIRKQSWRKGFGAAIVDALCRYAFETEDLPALKAYVNVANEGSLKILEHQGFIRKSEVVFAGRPCFDLRLSKSDYSGSALENA